MPMGDPKTDDLEWDDCLGWKLKRPLVEYIMPPTKPWEAETAQIICGHPFIQRLPEGEHAEFESFLREVFRTVPQ